MKIKLLLITFVFSQNIFAEINDTIIDFYSDKSGKIERVHIYPEQIIKHNQTLITIDFPDKHKQIIDELVKVEKDQNKIKSALKKHNIAEIKEAEKKLRILNDKYIKLENEYTIITEKFCIIKNKKDSFFKIQKIHVRKGDNITPETKICSAKKIDLNISINNIGHNPIFQTKYGIIVFKENDRYTREICLINNNKIIWKKRINEAIWDVKKINDEKIYFKTSGNKSYIIKTKNGELQRNHYDWILNLLNVLI